MLPPAPGQSAEVDVYRFIYLFILRTSQTRPPARSPQAPLGQVTMLLMQPSDEVQSAEPLSPSPDTGLPGEGHGRPSALRALVPSAPQ